MPVQSKSKLIFLLPNLLTAASLFLGVLSILASANGDFEKAGWLIIGSAIFDALDGKVARLTGTTSSFGLEFDSLADLVAFGVAPSMLLYFGVGISFGKPGIIVSAIFVIFGAVRLARFNCQTNRVEPNIFIGLPIPAAAVFIVCWMIFTQNYAIVEFNELFLATAFAVSLLMISNIRYASFKKAEFTRPRFMRIFIGILLLFSLMYLYFLETLTALVTLYVLSGVTRALYTLINRRRLFRNTPS